MKKVLSLIAANKQVDLLEAQAYWDDAYLKKFLRLAAVEGRVRKLVHNHVVPLVQRAGKAPNTNWVGVAELWFDTAQSAQSFIAASPQTDEIADPRLMPKIFHFRCNEIPMWDRAGPQNGPKVFHFFKAPAGRTKEESLKYWNEQHVKVGQGMGTASFVARYMQNHFIDSSQPIEAQFDFIGAPELWFDTVEDCRGVYKDASKNAIRDVDEDKFADRETNTTLATEERLIPIKTAWI
ncbi:MAG: EthD domain-containing protein [Methylocella sp.]